MDAMMISDWKMMLGQAALTGSGVLAILPIGEGVSDWTQLSATVLVFGLFSYVVRWLLTDLVKKMTEMQESNDRVHTALIEQIDKRDEILRGLGDDCHRVQVAGHTALGENTATLNRVADLLDRIEL